MIAQTFALAVLLVVAAGVSANVVQPSPVEVSNAQPVPVHHIVSNQPEVPHHPQVVGGSPVVSVEHQPQDVHHHQPQQPQYYAPSGLIQPVGEQQQQPQYVSGGPVQSAILKQYSAGGPAAASISAPAEQYGQPESASIPPNYKPFGSWGLYIGGNPADGYYSSYYKALGQSVSDKQQQQSQHQQVAPVVAVAGDKPVVSQASGFSSGSPQPLLKQAFSYQDQGYPYDSSYYTPADLNSGSRVSVAPQGYPQQVGGAQFGPSVYNYVEQPSVSGLSYSSAFAPAPEQYASTKRLGSSSSSSYATKSRDSQVPPAPVKGYQQQQQQQQGYYYAAGVPAFAYAAPAVVEHQQQHDAVHQQAHQQVIAYPVPVGSQIVGSQQGVEGSFAPFGVHGFTRYAVKPTVVAGPAPAAGVHSAPVGQFPVYKQVVGYQQPLSFYGYPLSQLHYSQGSSLFGQQGGSQVESSAVSSSSGIQHPQIAGAAVGEQSGPAAHPIPYGYPVEAASSEKSESKVENKPAAAAAAVQPVNAKPTTTTQ